MGFAGALRRLGIESNKRDVQIYDGQITASNVISGYEEVYYVDGAVSASGNGKTRAAAFKTFTEGIAALNDSDNTGKCCALIVAPGNYIEVDGITLSGDDNHIIALNPAPGATYLYGSGTAGSETAADNHALIITGSNNIVHGMTFYTKKDDKAGLALDGADGCIIDTCNFPPVTVDTVGYGVYCKGAGQSNIIRNCRFVGMKTAGINFVADGDDDPSRCLVEGNLFYGCAIGVNVACDFNDLTILNNVYYDGGFADENLTAAVEATSAFTAGYIVCVNDRSLQADEANTFVNDGAGTFVITNPTYATAIT